MLDRYGTVLLNACGAARVCVLTDHRVARLYGERLDAALRRAGYEPLRVEIPEGEASKSLATFEHVLGEMMQLGIDRRGILIAFGGGMISDLGGFVASAYMRGIRYVNMATSLIGQVDASVGGKVAVNSPAAKNLYGAFHHPSHVAADPEFLRTLGDRDFRSGMAEVIKVAILNDPGLFSELEQRAAALRARDPDALLDITVRAVRAKMRLVQSDPYESDLRRPLNLGHTLGHPIETDFAYQDVRHGEAVGIGTAVATLIAKRRGWLDAGTADRILVLLDRYDLLGTVGPLHVDAIVEHLRCVRMIRGDVLNFVLPEAIGRVRIVPELPTGAIVEGFEDYEAEVAARGLIPGETRWGRS